MKLTLWLAIRAEGYTKNNYVYFIDNENYDESSSYQDPYDT